MSRKKILFATDFSPVATAAFETAESLARSENALLLIVHVAPSVFFGGGDNLSFAPVERAALEGSLADVKPSDPNLDYEQHMLVGDPAKEIVRLAEHENIDWIVIGTHGRTGLARVLMGSVAEVVVRHAPCPVLAYKQPQHVAATTG
jgi:nucleotide-binding universal stress UspA family protein